MQDPVTRAKTRKESNAQRREYQYKKMVTLTKPEGETLDHIISDNECENLSQLCKKIAQGILKLW